MENFLSFPHVLCLRCVAFCRFRECGGNFMLIGVWLKPKLNTNFVAECLRRVCPTGIRMQIFVLSKHSIWFWLFSSLWWPQLFWLQSIMFRLMFKYLESRLTSITVIIRYLRIIGDEEKMLSHFPTLVFGFFLSFSSLQCYNINRIRKNINSSGAEWSRVELRSKAMHSEQCDVVYFLWLFG